MTRRQRDDLRFGLMLGFSAFCMAVDVVDILWRCYGAACRWFV